MHLSSGKSAMASGRKRNREDYCSEQQIIQEHQQTKLRFNNANNQSSHINHINLKEEILGLKLKLSTTDINQLELQLSRNTHKVNQRKIIVPQPHHKPKFKSSSVPALYIKIGNWVWKSMHEGDLVAKFYYGHKKLVWEFLFGSRKKKLEISWSQISAIKSYIDENETNRLEIEFVETPKLYKEVNYNSTMHTRWEETNDDFTNGQAHICKHHTIIFSPRVLDDPLTKLFQCDSRLLKLFGQPSSYLKPPLYQNQQVLDFSCKKVICGSSLIVPNNDQKETIETDVQYNTQPVISSSIEHSISNLPILQVLDTSKLDQSEKGTHHNGVEEQSAINDQILEIPCTTNGEHNDCPADNKDLLTLLESELMDDNYDLPELILPEIIDEETSLDLFAALLESKLMDDFDLPELIDQETAINQSKI